MNIVFLFLLPARLSVCLSVYETTWPNANL